MGTQSQCKAILSDLQAGKKITPLDAFLNHGCMRLSARIYDLRQSGYAVVAERAETSTGKKIARYRLAEEKGYA